MIAASVVWRYLDACRGIAAAFTLQFAHAFLQLLVAQCESVYELLLTRDFIADLLQARLQMRQADLQVYDCIAGIHQVPM
jgi:hypothetical protein